MSFTAYVAHNPSLGEPSINGHRMLVDCDEEYSKLAKRFIQRDGMFVAEIVDEEVIAVYAYMGDVKIIEAPIYDKKLDLAWQGLIEMACQRSGILLDL